MPSDEISRSILRPDGVRLPTPALTGAGRFDYRIVLEGVFTFRYGDVRFDAAYKAVGDGPFTLPHAYLPWTPAPPPMVEADPRQHRYVFAVPPEWVRDGRSLDVRVDTDRFVGEYLLTPSEVKDALGGQMTLRVFRIPLAPPNPWPLLAGASVPAALAVGGMGLLVRRRMALRGLSPDLQEALGRIEAKVRTARRAASRAHGRLLPHLRDRLEALRRGAWALARQSADLRAAQRLLDRRALQSSAQKLQRRIETLADEAAENAARAALEEKRRALARLDEMKQAEERCALRLTTIEAVLDSTCLALRGARATAATPPPFEESLRRALDAEVEAVAEAERALLAARARLETDTPVQAQIRR